MFHRYKVKMVILALVFSLVSLDVQPTVLAEGLKKIFSGSDQVVDLLHLARQNPNVVDNFGVGLRHAEAAVSSAEREYFINVGPINGVATANYVYASLYNPAGSGRTLSVKRVMVRANAVGGANFSNLSLRRATNVTGGTQIAATDIPKKNASSSNTVAEVRRSNPSAVFSGSADSRLLGQPMPGAAGYEYSNREVAFDSIDEPIILQPGEGMVLYQEEVGSTNQRVQALFEWEETESTPAAQDEYMMALPRVLNGAGANYVYNSFFNPSGSGRSAIVKRVWLGSETCTGAAIYTNNVVVKRISAASGGTQVAVANIPKKHTGSSNSVMDVRHTGVAVTQVGGADARLFHVTPCGATGQQSGWHEYNSRPEDEQIILQPGEGIALISEATGSANQINRMFVEWEEVPSGSTPASEGEYLWSSNRVEVAATLGTTFYTALNPTGSGRTALVKRMVIKVNADAAAAYSSLNFQRITAAAGGNLIGAADIPKKHTGTSNSIMQLRWCGATCATAITGLAYSGARNVTTGNPSDSGILKALAPGAVGQLHGQVEIALVPSEPLVLRPGEGIALYNNFLAGNVNHYIKISLEWDEESSAPSTANRYLIDIGALPGNTGVSFNYATFFNPSGSGRTAIIKQTAVRVNAITTAVHTPLQVKRISAASGGTQIAAADIPKKDTTGSNSVMDIRRTGSAATYSQSVDAQLLAVQTPAAASGVTTIAQMGWKKMSFEDDESIILQPGEGIVLNNNAAADIDHRIFWYLEWEEVPVASTPPAEGEYLMNIGPVTGSTAASHIYATLYNPSTSTRLYVLSRLGIRSNRIGTLTAPGNIPISIRRISSSSGGTLITPANVSKKHTGTANPTAVLRQAGVTATLAGVIDSRLLNIIAPAAAQQSIGVREKEIIFGDELVLYPGEGVALYQESAAGDANMRYYLSLQWKEVDIPVPPQSLTFSISDNTVGFGTLLSGAARYATGDGVGSASDAAPAHTISVATNATDGYVVLLSGSTLTCTGCGGATISSIGGTPAASSVGTEQFGIRAIAVSGSGSVSAPYNTANWALDTAAFPDTFATGAGDGVTTQFGVRYLSNIAANSDPGSYTSNLTYTVTSTF